MIFLSTFSQVLRGHPCDSTKIKALTPWENIVEELGIDP